MKKAWMALLVVALACAGAGAGDFDVTPTMVGNPDIIKGRVGFGDPNEGMIGPYGSWNDGDPYHLWGAGGYAQVDVTKSVTGTIDRILGTPNAWWELLEELGGQVYLVTEVGPASLSNKPQATAMPGVGIRLGPLIAEFGYDIVEGGAIEDEAGEELAESGPTYFIGISKTFRF